MIFLHTIVTQAGHICKKNIKKSFTMQRKLTKGSTMPNSILKFKLQKNVSLLAVKKVRPADPAVIIMRSINS